MQTSLIPMSGPTQPTGAGGAGAPGAGIVSTGWLGSQSIFERSDRKKIGGAFAISVGVHALIVLALIWGIWKTVKVAAEAPAKLNVVYLEQPGPGGGGGGSPAPAPMKKLDIPKTTPPPPTPVIPVPVIAPPPPPTPQLLAPVQTNMADLMQATGSSSVSLATYAGGGSGGGIGPGRGTGVGPGEGGGTGGGYYEPGNGIDNPQIIRKVDPKYTSEAMRAKITGEVWLDVIVQTNGTVKVLGVAKSLDKTFGLDQAAIEASKDWLFKPGTKTGVGAVPVRVLLIMEFRLH